VIQKTSRKNVTSTVLILTCICLRDGGSICQGRDTFLNASLRILNAPLHKRQFYNSITTHQYKRFIRHQHESYNLGGYYAHPLLLIDAHPPLGINETTKTYTWSDVIPLREELVCVFSSFMSFCWTPWMEKSQLTQKNCTKTEKKKRNTCTLEKS